MRLVCLVPILCVIITLSHVMAQLTLESARGKMKLKNFLHLHKHRLAVKPLASFEVAKEMKCTASCTKSEECFSFNVKRLTANSFLCELLNTSKYIDAENLTRDNSFSHYYLQDPCVPNPCVTGNCKPDKKAGFICQNCPAKIIGKRCDVCAVPNHNFALGKPTEQSSIYANVHGSFGSSLAVDGNKGDVYISAPGQPQCSITYDSQQDWWRVNFGETIPVARVAITNRGDCCSYRMSDFELRVGNSLVDNGVTNPKCGDRHNLDAGTTTIKCIPVMSGRYLVMQSQLTEPMNFCEVEVYCEQIEHSD